MSNEQLAKEITVALINAGLIHDAAYTAVSRMIKERLDKRTEDELEKHGAGHPGVSRRADRS